MTIRGRICAELRRGIDDVLSGRRLTYSGFAVPPAVVRKIMKHRQFKCSDIETNGWQVDWWLTFTKGEQSFTAFGCMNDGTFEFIKTEEA
jgi:hypothetical protein